MYVASLIVEEMSKLTSSVHDKWKEIGLELGLPLSNLEHIGRATDNCIRLVLNEWLQRKDKTCKKGGPTWSTLIQALESVGADKTTLFTCKAAARTFDQSNVIAHTV